VASSVDPAVFGQEVERQFGFLADDRFAGPFVGDGVVEFVSDEMVIGVYLEPRYGEVVTVVSARGFRAGLSCLYVAAGLGPAQAIGNTARTRHSLTKTVASNALALQVLLPRLETAEGQRLLAECHGR
jgi:hypothetical protein